MGSCRCARSAGVRARGRGLSISWRTAFHSGSARCIAVRSSNDGARDGTSLPVSGRSGVPPESPGGGTPKRWLRICAGSVVHRSGNDLVRTRGPNCVRRQSGGSRAVSHPAASSPSCATRRWLECACRPSARFAGGFMKGAGLGASCRGCRAQNDGRRAAVNRNTRTNVTHLVIDPASPDRPRHQTSSVRPRSRPERGNDKPGLRSQGQARGAVPVLRSVSRAPHIADRLSRCRDA